MGRFTLALGYVLTGDERYFWEYQRTFKPTRPIQPAPSQEWLAIVKQLNAANIAVNKKPLVKEVPVRKVKI
jgi:hypothetical protein